MVRHPAVGMRYQDALKTAIRHYNEGSIHIVESMIRQVEAHEGHKGAEEFAREVTDKARYRNGKLIL